jgi:nitroreductase
MTLLESLNWRYATKKFDSSKIISRNYIDKLKSGFNLSASSYGLQPVTLMLVHNKSIQKDLVPLSMNQMQVEQASHLAIFCVKTQIDSDYIIEYFERIKDIRSVDDSVIAPFRSHIIDSFSSKSSTMMFYFGQPNKHIWQWVIC